MTIKHTIKSALKRHVTWPASALWARVMALGIRPPASIGAYPDRMSAIARVSKGTPNSYDHDDIAPINFEMMCKVHLWDYPIMLWLERLLHPEMHVLDAGGHFGTKFIAFRNHIDLSSVDWNVYDLPAVVRAALELQRQGLVPDQIRFVDDPSRARAPDILLASGLLQYLDIELEQLVSKLDRSPNHILLNKVATTDGPTVFTLEKIGSGRIPYQIRNKADFERRISGMGYSILDSWTIPSLARTIATHPSLGASTSRGYVLKRET